MDRRPDSLVGAAPANVPGHGGVDILIARIFIFFEERDSLHDLVSGSIRIAAPESPPTLFVRDA